MLVIDAHEPVEDALKLGDRNADAGVSYANWTSLRSLALRKKRDPSAAGCVLPKLQAIKVVFCSAAH